MTQIRSTTSIHLWQGQPTATGHRGGTSTWVNLDATPAGSGITIHGTPAQIAALGMSIIGAANELKLPDTETVVA